MLRVSSFGSLPITASKPRKGTSRAKLSVGEPTSQKVGATVGSGASPQQALFGVGRVKDRGCGATVTGTETLAIESYGTVTVQTGPQFRPAGPVTRPLPPLAECLMTVIVTVVGRSTAV